MQATQPHTIREKIHLATNKYLAQADQWDTVAVIQQHTEKLFDQLQDLLNLKPRKFNVEREPQSDAEEVKHADHKFERAIMAEVRKFVLGLENSKIVALADI